MTPKYTVQSSWHVTGHMSTDSRDNDVCTLHKTNTRFNFQGYIVPMIYSRRALD